MNFKIVPPTVAKPSFEYSKPFLPWPETIVFIEPIALESQETSINDNAIYSQALAFPFLFSFYPFYNDSSLNVSIQESTIE